MQGLLSSIILLFLLISCKLSNQNSNQDKKSDIILGVNTAMDAQVKAWNSGDLEGFMGSYWHSDSLVFIGSKGMTLGWKPALERYQRSYRTPQEMGRLSFGRLKEQFLQDSVLQIIGTWKLERQSDTLQGIYSLIWMPKNGQWVIVSDHSS